MKTIDQVREFIIKNIDFKNKSKSNVYLELALRLILREIACLKEILDFIDSEDA